MTPQETILRKHFHVTDVMSTPSAGEKKTQLSWGNQGLPTTDQKELIWVSSTHEIESR